MNSRRKSPLADGGCYLSTSCFRKAPLAEAIRSCAELGVRNVEVSAPHPCQTIDEFAAVFRAFRAEGFRFTIHNYFPPPEESFVLNPGALDAGDREATRRLVDGVLALSEPSGTPVYGIHTGYVGKAMALSDGMFAFDETASDYAAAVDAAVAFINETAPRFQARGVVFALENLFPATKRRHSLFCSLEEIDEIMNQVPASVGLLLDLGHLNISATLLGFDRMAFLDRFLARYGDRLVEVHISENNGEKDEHLPLYADSWQFGVLDLIRAAPVELLDRRIYCLEARAGSPPALAECLGRINERLIP